MMCARRLRDTVDARRTVKDVSLDEILDFLNSPPDEVEYRKSNDVRSLISLVRGSFHRLGAKLYYVEGDKTNLRLMIGDKLIQGTESRQLPTAERTLPSKTTGLSTGSSRSGEEFPLCGQTSQQ